MSDIGNNPNCDSYNPTESTKQPYSKNWTQYLAEKYGHSVIKSDAGGNNFAYGGAESGYDSKEAVAYDIHRGVRTQVIQFLARNHHLDSDAFYSLLVGGNDILGYFLGYTGKTEAQVISECGPNIVDSLTNIYDAGARIMILGNVLDLANTPLFYPDEDLAAHARRMSINYNEAVRSHVNDLGFDVIQIDLYSLFDDALLNKSKYGFLYGPEDCASLNPGVNPDLYIFWDIIHPTPKVYQIMADYYYSVLQAPFYFAKLTDTPYQVSIAQYDIIRQRLSKQPNCDERKLYIYAEFDPINPLGHSTHTTEQGISMGAIYQIDPSLSVGAQYSYAPNQQTIDHHTYKYQLKDNAVLLFADYRQNLFFVNLITGWSDLKYRDITRQIPLGPVTESAQGKTHGYQCSVGLSGGGWFPNSKGSFKTGPAFTSTYQYTSVHGYSERGDKDYLNMVFNKQHTNTLDAGIGWNFNLKKSVASHDLFLMVADVYANKQFLNHEHDIHFHLQSIAGSHGAMPVSVPAGYYTRIGVSATYVFSCRVALFLGYNGYIGKNRYQNHVMDLGLGVYFF